MFLSPPKPGAFWARADDDHPLVTMRAAASKSPPPEQTYFMYLDFMTSSPRQPV
jgi:hypothetical protein